MFSWSDKESDDVPLLVIPGDAGFADPDLNVIVLLPEIVML